jgi:hypothetical protein
MKESNRTTDSVLSPQENNWGIRTEGIPAGSADKTLEVSGLRIEAIDHQNQI